MGATPQCSSLGADVQSKNKRRPDVTEQQWLNLVARTGCAVCDDPGPVEVHEIEQGAWFLSIGLCTDCHRGNNNGLHGRKAMWNIKKLDELGALAITTRRVFTLLLERR